MATKVQQALQNPLHSRHTSTSQQPLAPPEVTNSVDNGSRLYDTRHSLRADFARLRPRTLFGVQSPIREADEAEEREVAPEVGPEVADAAKAKTDVFQTSCRACWPRARYMDEYRCNPVAGSSAAIWFAASLATHSFLPRASLLLYGWRVVLLRLQVGASMDVGGVLALADAKGGALDDSKWIRLPVLRRLHSGQEAVGDRLQALEQFSTSPDRSYGPTGLSTTVASRRGWFIKGGPHLRVLSPPSSTLVRLATGVLGGTARIHPAEVELWPVCGTVVLHHIHGARVGIHPEA